MQKQEERKREVENKRENKGVFSWLFYKTWHPFQTLRSVLVISLVVGCLFIGLSILQLSLYLKTHQYQIIYATNDGCVERNNKNNCESIIEITHDLQPPIAFIYFLQNAYINHRKYIDSVSVNQLAGKTIDMGEAMKLCQPFVTNQNMKVNKSYTGVPLDPAFIASPCGFATHLVFNDTFSLYSQHGAKVPINEANLFENIYGRFKRSADSESTQWIDPQSNHYMIWMKNSGVITKYKLWGRIEQSLPAGKYNIVASNDFHIGAMKIKKGIQIINLNEFGSAVYFYPIIFAIMGIACLAYALFMKLKMPDYDQLLYVCSSQQK